MGWAKYYEDNNEILIDRLLTSQPFHRELSVASMRTESTSIPTRKNEPQETPTPCWDDRILVCKECGTAFLFTTQAQKAFHAKNWVQPKRCKKCRKKREERQRVLRGCAGV